MLQVYNSLTDKKEPFIPLHKDFVGMYVCGPTVSSESHLGHARSFIVFDVIYRYLLYLNFKVRFVRNITDAGHFEEENREGEDKINNKALLEKLEPMELVNKYTRSFHVAMQQFNALPPSIEPTATGHITEQIDMIEKIIEYGYGYEVNGSVYFNVEKYHAEFSQKKMPYGILSNRNIQDLLESTRSLANQDEKKSKIDFALWKNAPPQHLMRWKSPWGWGFPGWHIECSAMSQKYLGQQFDIHGGGIDLLFPHHECEIAQGAVCTHLLMATYWLHSNLITINGRKMGKSYNNTIKLSELFTGVHPLLDKPYHPMAIRFFILQTHYRSTLDFSNEALQAAEKGYKRLWEAYQQLISIPTPIDVVTATNESLDKYCAIKIKELHECMNDDFNTAKVLANMFDIVPTINSLSRKQIALNSISSHTLISMKTTMKQFIEDILGLTATQNNSNKMLQDMMQLIVLLRKSAKEKKDFVTSDAIRNQLQAMGITLKDEKDGTTSWTI